MNNSLRFTSARRYARWPTSVPATSDDRALFAAPTWVERCTRSAGVCENVPLCASICRRPDFHRHAKQLVFRILVLVAQVLPIKFHIHCYLAWEPQWFRHAWQLKFVKPQLRCLLRQPYVVARCQEIGAHTKNLKRASVHPRNPLYQQNHGVPYSVGVRGN